MPTGTVSFKDGSTSIGTAVLSGGKAVFKTSTLAVSTHAITATYLGSGSDVASVSAILSQTVNAAASFARKRLLVTRYLRQSRPGS